MKIDYAPADLILSKDTQEYHRGTKALEEWHKECDARRQMQKDMSRRWIAPEHNRKGCSWKGEAIVATFKVTRRVRGNLAVHIEIRGCAPIYGGDPNKKFENYTADPFKVGKPKKKARMLWTKGDAAL